MGKESARKSSDWLAAALSAISIAPFMLSTPSSGSRADDTRRCVQPTPELTAQPASASPSVEPHRQNGCQP